jgi:hypothetical protein
LLLLWADDTSNLVGTSPARLAPSISQHTHHFPDCCSGRDICSITGALLL